ncbi:MAG: hypothetical protein ACREQL_05340, partial [Candidatus Binatia bacterium]
MRLAMKLLSTLAVLTVIVLGVSALVEYRRREELLAMDIEAEGRMAAALRAVVVKVCELAGPDSAKHVIDTLNVATPQRSIRWLAPNEMPQVPGRDLPAELRARMA